MVVDPNSSLWFGVTLRGTLGAVVELEAFIDRHPGLSVVDKVTHTDELIVLRGVVR